MVSSRPIHKFTSVTVTGFHEIVSGLFVARQIN